MDRKKRARWIATTSEKGLKLPYIGAVQDGIFYHLNCNSFELFHEGFDILKDYGTMTFSEWESLGGYSKFLSDFPPTPSPVEKYDPSLSSWISPEGEIYLCKACDHECLARKLCHHLDIETIKYGANALGDELYDKGWCKLSTAVFVSEPTQKQRDTLFDIFAYLRKNNTGHELCKRIDRELNPAKPERIDIPTRPILRKQSANN